MKQRKFLALVLALVLTMSLSAPALAADEVVQKSGSTEITIGTLLNIPTIKVTISPITDVILNPYGLTTKVNASITGTVTSDTLISAPGTIKSESQIKMEITATPKVTVSAGTVAVKNESTVGATGKAVFVQLGIGNAADATNAGSYTVTNEQKAIAKLDSETTFNEAKLTLDACDTTNTERYGAYKITGDSAGLDWDGTEQLSIKVVFDIQPKVGA